MTKMTTKEIINCEKWIFFDKCIWLLVNMGIDTSGNHLSKSSVRRNQWFIEDNRLQIGETNFRIPPIVTNHMQDSSSSTVGYGGRARSTTDAGAIQQLITSAKHR